MKCQCEGCLEEATVKGYCGKHNGHYNKGDKEIGVYALEFVSIEGSYYYIGMSFTQSIETEESKHISAIRRHEKGKDKELQRCFEKICLEHPEMEEEEVIQNYIIKRTLYPYDAIGGYLLQFNEDGTFVEVTDNDTIKKVYLKQYVDFIEGNYSRGKLVKNIDLSQLSMDEREIQKFINYKCYIINNKETQIINEYKEKYGDHCLNSNKVKKI